jgi:enoyl-CoA hydratase/carnithine racemase
VLPQADLVSRAKEIAATIASRAPVAVETAKLNLSAAAWMPSENAIAYERDLQTICFATEDAAEGRRAFAEKRNPYFRKK